eukprot:scaffold64035_cov21-Tisochrysis_lutea.AAC.3
MWCSTLGPPAVLSWELWVTGLTGTKNVGSVLHRCNLQLCRPGNFGRRIGRGKQSTVQECIYSAWSRVCKAHRCARQESCCPKAHEVQLHMLLLHQLDIVFKIPNTLQKSCAEEKHSPAALLFQSNPLHTITVPDTFKEQVVTVHYHAHHRILKLVFLLSAIIPHSSKPGPLYSIKRNRCSQGAGPP